ncbi:hypothetical protein PAXINDRAFT_170543, partial [Paxillus involutus ATCC 200175]
MDVDDNAAATPTLRDDVDDDGFFNYAHIQSINDEPQKRCEGPRARPVMLTAFFGAPHTT